METKRKTYDELTFTDDFMFCEVLRNHPELCRDLAELVTGRKVLTVHLPEAQRHEKFLYEGKGVRFDITFEDDAHTVYDIEMQTTLKETLNKRSRYYGSMLDMDHLRRGAKYSELPNTYIVFICLEDPFTENIARYTFQETCLERLDLELEDGRSIIFINTKGENGASAELLEFCEYLNGHQPASDFTNAINKAVNDQKDDEAGRRKYMTLQEHYDEEREIGKAEGIEIGTEKGKAEGIEIGTEKGIKIGKSEMIQNAVAAGKSVEQIADALGLSVKEVQQLSQP
ncbi:MAG: Rpn family recombination-promoting nuclease/putative transposase [Lachnospiraceae bacterium]|nr:Rpn family recombination-promoting nuclease/putative transposase [Lachnospiraceae bacterium]